MAYQKYVVHLHPENSLGSNAVARYSGVLPRHIPVRTSLRCVAPTSVYLLD